MKYSVVIVLLALSLAGNAFLAWKFFDQQGNIEAGALHEMTLDAVSKDLISVVKNCPLDKAQVPKSIEDKNNLVSNENDKIKKYPLTYHFSKQGKLKPVTISDAD
ncbi:MAG: hypothetical protein V4691_04740 [Pseudomonadota bacterium]